MSTRRPRLLERCRSRIGLSALFCVVLWAFSGCSSKGRAPFAGDPDSPTLFGPGEIGDPCDKEGVVADCGRVHHNDGTYVTCSLGHSTCQNGFWGPCIGDHIVTKSVPNARLTQSGLRLLSGPTTPACNNLCDPYCMSTAPDPVDVDASGVEIADGGGLTLTESDSGVTVVTPTSCVGLQCKIVTCSAGTTTTISGTVFDPAGNNPLFDANVYIPLMAEDALPAFSSGASCDSCGAAASLDALRATQTDASGKFVLADVPAGANIPIVVQMGKWRREIMLKSVTSCRDNAVTNNCTADDPDDCVFRLPRNHTDGLNPVLGTYTAADLPQIAIVTGSADPFDCLLLKAGIDPAEVGDYNSSKRVHFYASDTKPGNKLDAAYGADMKGSALWNSLNGPAPALMSYDVVLLPCEGGAIDKQSAGNTPYQNFISYANNGGRAFTTHFSYTWLQYPAGKKYVAAPDNWATVANWSPTGTTMTSSINTQDPLTGVVNTGFPKGSFLSQWLQNVGASTSRSRLTIHEGRQDLTSIGPSTQAWMTARDTAYAPFPNYTNLFTFNTPVTAAPANQCGRVVFSDFHVSAKALIAQCTPQACGAIKCGPAGDGCGNALICGTCTTGKTCGGGGTPGVCGTGSTCAPRTCAAQGIECGPAGDGCGNALDCGGCAGGQACGAGGPGKCAAHQCLSDTDCGFTSSCIGASPGPIGQCSEPCSASSDCPSNTFACAGSVAGSCQQTNCVTSTDCGTGRICQAGTCTCTGADDCNGGACAGMTCSAIACHSSATCGNGACGGGTCAAGAVCHKASECGPAGTCGGGTGSTAGKCSTSALACHQASDCDSGSCGAGTGSTVGTCASNSALCHVNGDCDSNSCGLGTGSLKGTCAYIAGRACHLATDCDSGACGSGTGSTAGACSTNAQVCHSNANCDSGACGSGTGGVKGTCAQGSAFVCHTNTDCDSGACGTGTGSTPGACASNSQSCHSNATCDSGTCGTGTGAVKGTCAKGTGFACHLATDCDSGACGSGLGSTAGTCASNGQSCHSNAQCDSATCGTGTGAVKGTCAIGAGTACHKTTDCDSGACGAGTGSTAGTCATNGQICHANAQCDSALCGSGVGSSTGLCTAGTCTASSQCGTGGTCTAGKCVAGTCALDSVCGTAAGVCTGAKCGTATACAGDSACSVSKLCNGAKCSAPATCAADSACTSSNSCSGATCGAALACAGDSACSVSKLCNSAKCSTPATCAADSACPASNACSGATCGAALACAGDSACTVSKLCNAAKCSTPVTCAADSACPASNSCVGAKCGAALACAGDTACSVSKLCNAAKCSTPATCAGDSGCPASNSCTGAKCGAASCAGDSACTVSKLCNAAKCSTANCAGDGACPVGNLCNGAKCSTSACGADSQCPLAVCSNAKCNASACATSSECGAGSICGGSCQASLCTQDADCASGTCNNGQCGCATGDNCGGSQSCIGAAKGACQKACTRDTDCAPDRCINGQCGGCTDSADCHDNSYPTACGGIPAANYGTCSAFQWNQFPEACHPGNLSPQEKALEFMFFDLTACVSPDNLPPPLPVVLPSYNPASFVQDFSASCSTGNLPVWREFDWQAQIPPGASIVMSAQSGSTVAGLNPAVPVTFAKATADTDTGPSMQNYDVGFIDTGHNGTGAFNTADPGVISRDLLRVTITLNPTLDHLTPPTLLHWKVQYDCVPAE